MKAEIPDDVMREGIALGVERFLSASGIGEQLVEMLLAQVQFLDPDQAAAVLRMPESTFSRKVNEEQLLSKVTLMGPKHPRYLLPEILEEARKSAIKRAGAGADEPKIIGLKRSKAA